MSDTECYPKADFFRKPNFPKFRNCGFNTRHDNREVTLIEFFENRICPNICRMFRSVDWTHDMIIVKWHLFIWHERKFCALTSAPPVQSTQTGQRRSTLFHANCSGAQVYVLHHGQFIFAPSFRRRSFLQVLQSTERKERYFEKFLCIWWWQMLWWKHVLTKKLLKFRIWFRQWRIAHVRSESYAKAEFFRMPNFPNCGFNTRHDNRKVTLIEFFENRICPNIYRMFRSVEWTTTW